MSAHKKKHKPIKARKSGDLPGSTDAMELSILEGPNGKDIDAHPIDIGNSLVVLYRDASHRLVKV
jgi:hypothetical protein